jgi:SAM-dependent methyltransferase
LPLPDYYLEQLLKFGGSVDFDNRETLNWRNYSCPNCNATDRDRLYALYLNFRFVQSPRTAEKQLFIDFAPSKPLSGYIRTLLDISYFTVDIAMSGVDYHADITNLSMLNDDSVDFFICSHVFEHVSDDRKALSELLRILKSSGQGILMVPIQLNAISIDEDPAETSEAERWRRFGQGDHIRSYSKRGFVERVLDSGLKLTAYGINSFGAETFRRSGITPQSVLYITSR